MSLVLENEPTRAEILPRQGGRVQHLVDKRSSRELLYVTAAKDADSDDFLAATTGGWDLMFPNDEPWNGHPDHGRVWNAPFSVRSSSPMKAELVIEVRNPPATVTRSYELLAGPEAGLRETIRISANGETGPFLVAPHAALDAGGGWRVELPEGARDIAADEVLPGRFQAGQVLGAAEWETASRVPDPSEDLIEVLYVDGVRSGNLLDASGRLRVRVAWSESLSHLWICVLTGQNGPDAFLLLEPCTARPYRLHEAIPAGNAIALSAGDEWVGWMEVAAGRPKRPGGSTGS